MKYYQCKKCSTVLTSSKRPSSLNCPRGSMHSWSDLGEEGNDNYQCKKCAVLVKVKRRPSGLNCPSGGMHTWTKM